MKSGSSVSYLKDEGLLFDTAKKIFLHSTVFSIRAFSYSVHLGEHLSFLS